jgi:carbonic anhydrase
MQALADGLNDQCCPNIRAWLKHGEAALDKVNRGIVINPALSRQNQISQANVLQQLEHIKSYPFIRERIENQKLRIHGWWFDIAHADVYCYEQNLNQFVLIDEQEGRAILQRLQ